MLRHTDLRHARRTILDGSDQPVHPIGQDVTKRLSHRDMVPTTFWLHITPQEQYKRFEHQLGGGTLTAD
jgi:hypothetical protein